MDEHVIERLQHLPITEDQENTYCDDVGVTKWSNPANSVNYIDVNDFAEIEGSHLNSIGNHLSNCDDSIDAEPIFSSPPAGTKRKRKGKMERQKERIKSLQASFDLLKDENDDLKQNIKDMEIVAEKRENRIIVQDDEGARTVISTLQAENVRLMKEVANELCIKEQLEEELNEAKLESLEAKEECSYHKSRIEELETQVIKIRKDFNESERRYNEVQEELKDKDSNINVQIETLKSSNDQLEVGLRNEIDEKKKLGEELNNLNARWMIKEEDFLKLNLENKMYKCQVEELKEAAQKEENNLKNLEKEVIEIKEENENLKEEVSHTNQQKVELTSKMDESQKSLAEILTERDEYKRSCEYVQRNLDDVYKEWSVREKELKILEEGSASLQREIQAALAEKEEALEEKKTAIRQNEITQFENVQLQESLKQSQATKEWLVSQVDIYRNEVQNLKQQIPTQRDIEGCRSRSRRRKRRKSCFGFK